MEYRKLNEFVLKNHLEISQLINRKINSLDQLIKEIKSQSNKPKKLYDSSREMSKMIDFYDEKTKINLDRKKFTEDCFGKLKRVFTEEKLNDYKDVFQVIINESLEFDQDNWNKFYDTILESTENGLDDDDIDKNILYSLDYEDLTPRQLITLCQKNMNDEMIEGGTFSFQSYTQEMMAIVNEFVISKGKAETKKYLDQGIEKDIKVSELLKEVNAASLVEPFTFQEDKPVFKRAPAGQFDGFILQKNSAKVILATKSENTNIEGDSVFRHFITAMVIKKKIDETVPNINNIKRKEEAWLTHYTSKRAMDKYTRDVLSLKRETKSKANIKTTLKDYPINSVFQDSFKEAYFNAEHNGHKTLKIDSRLLDVETRKKLFGDKKSESGVFKIKMDDADLLMERINDALSFQNGLKNDLKQRAIEKIHNPKFKEQIELDAKKEEMVKNAGYLSIKEMIFDFNKSPKTALLELGIFDNLENVDEFGYEEMEKLKDTAKKLNVELIYFGSVSGKKSAPEHEYDAEYTEKMYKNKEFRYGLNLLAYANILSSSQKDNFKITTDASLEFIKQVELRAVTKKKNGEFDLDLEKINNTDFMRDVIYVNYKAMYEQKEIKADSIDFFENFLNSTNVLLNDFMQDYNIDLEDNPNTKIEDSFNLTMKNATGRDEDFNLVKTIESMKVCLTTPSIKIKNVSLVDAINQRLNEIIKNSDQPEMKELLKKYPVNETTKNQSGRKQRRNRINGR